MTPRERANNLLMRCLTGSPGLAWTVNAIEQAVAAAVEEEREACAKIVEDLRNSFPDSDLDAINRKTMAAKICDQIRARGNKD